MELTNTWTKPLAIALVLAVFTGIIAWFRPLLVNQMEITAEYPRHAGPYEDVAILVQARNHATGKAIPEAELELKVFGLKKKVLKGKTDANGSHTFRFKPQRLPPKQAQPWKLVAKHGELQSRIVGLIQPSKFAQSKSPLFIVTDKPLYQPGQTVQYSAFYVDLKTLQPKQETPVTASLHDPRGMQIWQREQVTSKHGNVNGSIELATGIRPGRYQLEMKAGDSRRTLDFTVKQYVPRRIRSHIDFGRPYLALDTEATATVRLRYYSGQPAANARVSLELTGADTIVGKTDKDGITKLLLPALQPLLGNREYATISYKLHVDDGGLPEIKTGQIPLYPGSTIFEILADGGTVLPNADNQFMFFAYHPDGSPAPGSYQVQTPDGSITVAVPDIGFAPFTVAAEGDSIMLETGGRQFRWTALMKNRIRIRPSFNCRSVEIELAPGIRDDVRHLEIAQTVDGRTAPTKTIRNVNRKHPDGRITVPLAAQADCLTRIHATARLTSSEAFHARLALPSLSRTDRLKLSTSRKTLGPQEQNEIRLRHPAGAATVIVTNAAITERSDAARPEDRVDNWILDQAEAHQLPPPLIAALKDGAALPFLPLPYQASTQERQSNAGRLQHVNRQIRHQWGQHALAAVLSLLIATGIVAAFVFFGGRPVTIVVITCVIVFLGSMLLPVLSKARERARRVAGANIPEDLAQASRDQSGTHGQMPLARDLRQDFPETLLFLPEVETDSAAPVTIPFTTADNLTTWHVSAIGLADSGGLSGTSDEFVTSKTFFIKPELPVALVRNDEPRLRIRVFNNSPEAINAEIRLAPADWFSCKKPRLTGAVPANGNRVFSTTIRILSAGSHKVRLSAQAGEHTDQVLRNVTVTEYGKRVSQSRSGRLRSDDAATIRFDDGGEIESLTTLRVRATPAAELLSGLDGMLRRPHGCFEQTTSINYPNIMILDYLSRIDCVDDKLRKKAVSLLQIGYQRIVGFEVSGGGFSLYGKAPTDPWLSALGLRQLHAMKRHIPVDPRPLKRTQDYVERTLSRSRQSVQAAMVWALADSGVTVKDKQLVTTLLHLAQTKQHALYDRLLALNACIATERDPLACKRIAAELASSLSDSKVHGRTLMGSYGRYGAAECRALALIALNRCDGDIVLRQSLVDEIIKDRSSRGDWGSTQATVLSLQALVEMPNEECSGILTASYGSETLEIPIRLQDTGPIHREFAAPGPVTLSYKGTGRVSYSATHHGYLRWSDEVASLDRSGLNLSLGFPRDHQIGNVSVMHVKVRDTEQQAQNCMAALGLGDVFRPDPASLQALIDSGRIRNHELRNGRLILYLGELSKQGELNFPLGLLPTCAGRFALPSSSLYEYYAPDNVDVQPGQIVEIE